MSIVGPMFNPRPRIQVVPITPARACIVVDDALLEPERWVDHAVAHRDAFIDSPHNAFPGPELALPEPAQAQLAAFFAQHIRGHFDAQRTLRTHARLSLTTRRPEELQPRQWLCHVDRLGLAPGECIVASVLYLFRDTSLGGTGFYVPQRPLADIVALVHASATLPADRFAAEYGVEPGYMTASNAWFRKVQSIAPRWNRLIFYPGTVMHSGDITAPQRLDPDPRRGRLTVNGFFTCAQSRVP